MTWRVPLGQVEGLSLEFKGREALGDPWSIGREVVAMLNAEGGTIWIGIGEENGYAVRVESVPDPLSALRSLRDHLIDTVEPSPTDRELRLETIEEAPGESVLLVEVTPADSRRPYSQIRREGRRFVLRVADRIRILDRSELAEAFRRFPTVSDGTESTELAIDEAASDVLTERRDWLAGADPSVRLHIQPVPLANTFQHRLQEEELGRLLRDPELVGFTGSHVLFSSPYSEVSIEADRLIGRVGQAMRTEIRNDGAVVHVCALGAFNIMGKPGELWPYALMKQPTALVRLARLLYAAEKVEAVVIDLSMVGVSGLTLRPYDPQLPGYRFATPKALGSEVDLAPPRPFVFDRRELLNTPDRCARRIYRWVYQAYGLREDVIPDWRWGAAPALDGV